MPTIAEAKKLYPFLEGYTDNDVIDVLHGGMYPDVPREQLAQAYGVKPPVEPAKPRSWGEAASDTGRAVMGGLAGLAKTGGDLYGLASGDMDNPVSELGKNAQEYWNEGKSQALKDKLKARDQAIDAADGVLGKFGAAVTNTVTDPALMGDALASNIATMLPGAAAARPVQGAMAARALAAGPITEAAALAAGKTAAKVATGVSVGTGAVQQGADVASQTYDDAMKKTAQQLSQNPDFVSRVNAGEAPRDVAMSLGLSAARAAFLPAAAISVATNAIPGGTLMERALIGGAARDTIKQGAKYGVLKSTIKGGLGNATGETIEEGGGQFAGNVAKKAFVDPNQKLDEDVGKNAGLGFSAGLAMGVPGGMMQRQDPTPAAPAPVIDPVADAQAKRNAELVPLAERVVANPVHSTLTKAALAGNTGAAADAELATQVAQNAQAATPAAPAADPLSERTASLLNASRGGVYLDALRTPDSPFKVNDFIKDIAVIRSPSARPEVREMALARLEQAAEWATQNPAKKMSPSTEDIVGATTSSTQPTTPTTPTTPLQRQAGADRDAHLQSQLANASTDFERNQIKEQLRVNSMRNLGRPLTEQITANTPAKSPSLTLQEQKKLEGAAQMVPAAAGSKSPAADAAMKRIQDRQGVASQEEADMLSQAGYGKPYDRIDPDLRTGAKPFATQPRSSTRYGDQGAEARARQEELDARNAEGSRKIGQRPGTEAAAAATPIGPTSTQVTTILRTPAFQRSASDKATLARASQGFNPSQLALLERTANTAPGTHSTADRMALRTLQAQEAGNIQQSTERGSGTLAQATQAAGPMDVATPNVVAAPGEGTAALRKRRATLKAIAESGLTTVERRNDGGFYMVDSTRKRQHKLTGPADAALAKKAVKDVVDAKAHAAATSPNNDRSEPTGAQIDAVNWKKGEKFQLNGQTVVIESPEGSTRRSKPGAEKAWETKMASHYGDLAGTKGADGDPVDVFVGPDPSNGKIFVIDQNNQDGSFDEHKVMMGYANEAAARAGYLANYEKGWTGLAAMTPVTPAGLNAWLKTGDTQKPFGGANGPTRSEAAEVPAPGNEGWRDNPLSSVVDRRAGGGVPTGRSGATDTGPSGTSGRGSGAVLRADAADDHVDVFIDGIETRISLTSKEPAYAGVMRTIANKFGKQVKFFTSGTDSDGFVVGTEPNTIFLNGTKSSINPMAVFGHELLHLVKKDSPKIYAALEKVVTAQLKKGQNAAYRREYFGALTNGSSYIDNPLMANEAEELVSDVGGNLMADPAFWKEVFAEMSVGADAKTKGLIAKLADTIYKLIDDLLVTLRAQSAKLSQREKFAFAQAISDLEKVRAEFKSGLAEYIKANGISQAAMQGEILKAGQNAKLSTARNQTSTSAFKDWFKDSKVVDAEGKPLVVFHGTKSDFEVFDLNKAGSNNDTGMWGTGFYFSPIKNMSTGYGDKLKRVYLSLQNPLILHANKDWPAIVNGPYVAHSTHGEEGKKYSESMRKKILEAGYDGVIQYERVFRTRDVMPSEKISQIVAFYPAQIKSATQNNGDFDPNTANITQSPVRDNGTDATQNTVSKTDGNNPAARLGQAAAADAGETPDYGTARAGAVSVLARHYADQPRSSLSGAAFGRGLKGAERKRLEGVDPRLSKRIYFYVDQGHGIRPESGVGAYAHEVRLNNIYDPASKLVTYKGGANEFEAAVLDAGFDGYMAPSTKTQGAVVLLGNKHRGVPVKPIGQPKNAALPADTQPTSKAEVLMSRELNRIELSAIPGARLRSGTLTVPQESFKAANQEMARIDSAIRFSPARAADALVSEYDKVVAQFKGTDGWLKAPNGNDTNLNERQWVHVRTPAFKKWFGDWQAYGDHPSGVWNDDKGQVSKAVDANGEPLVVYHGADAGGFTTFNAPGGRARGDVGIFTSDNWNTAASYVTRGRVKDIVLEDNPTTIKEFKDLDYSFDQTERDSSDDDMFRVYRKNGAFHADYESAARAESAAKNIGGSMVEMSDGQIDHTYTDPDGNQSDPFKSEQEAVDDAISMYTRPANTTPGVYALFVNLRNPGEEDFEGAIWNGQREDQFNVYVGTQEDPMSNSAGSTVFGQAEADRIAEANDGEVVPAQSHWGTTDDAVREARSNKNDGAIIRQVIDDGPGAGGNFDAADVFVAFDPNQLKSADFNSGEYSLKDDDIRMSPKRPGSDAGHKREIGTGRYVGAPDWIGASPQQLSALRGILRNLVKEGERGRFWYENSSTAILDVAGGDKAEAEKIVSLVAIYSPNNTVPGNTSMALKAYFQHKAGQTIRVGTKANDAKAIALMDGGEPWSGIKTNSFYQNLMVEIDPSKLDAGVSTMDMWIALAFDYGMKALDQGPKYRFAEIETARLARAMGWTPHQVQAAIWTAIKGRVEASEAPRKAYELKQGIAQMVDDVDPDTGKVTKSFQITKGREKDHFKAATRFGMRHELTPEDVSRSKYDFSDALRERAIQISWEAKPGKTSGVLPGIFKAPLSQQLEYLQAMVKALSDAKGNDLISKGLGIATQSSIGVAGWQGVTGYGAQDTMSVAVPGGTVDASARDMIALWANIRGLLLAQEGMAWHYPYYKGTKSEQNGIDVQLGRPLTIEEGEALYQALIRELGHSYAPPIHTDTGFRLLNFPDAKFALMGDNIGAAQRKSLMKESDVSNRAFFATATSAIQSVDSIEAGLQTLNRFQSDGELYENDWKNGDQDYRATIKEIAGRVAGNGDNRWAGRSDIFEWIDGDLAPRVAAVNADFAKRYGWDKDIQQSPGRADAGELPQPGRVRGSDGVLAGTRRPYQGDGRQGTSLEGLPAKIAVDGKPTIFAGFKPAQDAAAAYAKEAGLEYNPPKVYAKVDADRATRIAEAFDGLKHDPANPEVKAAYDAMIQETLDQYQSILKTGLKVEFNEGSDPYGNPRNAILDVVENNHLFVFSTKEGFGSSELDVSDNPLLAETEFMFGDKPALANDIFRVVHDYFGHIKEGVGFRADGEENAWRSHAAMYSPLARRAMTTETRGQNSWVNHGPNAEFNKTASGAGTIYADQKAGLLPAWVAEEGATDASLSDARPTSGTVSKSNVINSPARATDRPTALIELRKRKSILESLQKCLG